MSLPEDIEFEGIKARVLSRLIEGSVFPRDKESDEVAGQKAVAALESFLYEAFCLIRDDVLLECLLPKSMAPEILREERKLIQPGTSKIGVVTVGSMKNSLEQIDPVLILHLCGTYLERIGFDIGEQVGVFWGEKELILRSVSGCDEGCDQSQEV